MSPVNDDIDRLRAEVALDPCDPFHRCNLACMLATAGRVDEALEQLAAAFSVARTPITAGCVASALREAADCISRAWSLPTGSNELSATA